MISTINEIIDNLNNYTKINRKIVKQLAVLDEKIETITRYEATYDLGLSHTNLEFKKDLLELQLEYRIQNLKCCLTKIYSDMGGIYSDVGKLLKKIHSVLKDQKVRLPSIPKIVLSEKNKTIDIKDFGKWLKNVEQLLESTRGKIRMLNEKRDAFETMIRNELPSIDLRQTMNLQQEDLLNEYDRIRHKFVSILNFNYYVTKHILQYTIHGWTNKDKVLERNASSPINRVHSPVFREENIKIHQSIKPRRKSFSSIEKKKNSKVDKVPKILEMNEQSGLNFTFFNSSTNKQKATNKIKISNEKENKEIDNIDCSKNEIVK
jgi:hypothetical protein